jgi:exonuclease III
VHDATGTPPANEAHTGDEERQHEGEEPTPTEILTWNVRGVMDGVVPLEEMAQAGYAVMAIVDTHLKPTNHKAAWLRETLAGYSLFFNTWQPTREHPTHAGVMMAINENIAKGATQLPFRRGSRGRILEVRIDTPGESGHTTLVTTYAPHKTSPMEDIGDETHTGEEDGAPVNPVTVHLRNLSAAIRDARARGDEVMVAGDHNAVAAPADRTGEMSQRDKEWKEWMDENEMKMAGRAEADANTHSYQAENNSATTSRIDDWMTI